MKGHEQGVTAVVFSPDGKTLASGSGDTIVKLWKVATGENTATLKGRLFPIKTRYFWHTTLAFSSDGKKLASGHGQLSMGNFGFPRGEIMLWDITSGEGTAPFQAGERDFCGAVSVAFSPDGKTLASGSVDRTVKLWDVATGKEIRSIQETIVPEPGLAGYSSQVLPLAFSPDGKTLAAGSHDPTKKRLHEDTTIKVWDVASGKTIANLAGHDKDATPPSRFDASLCVAFSPDGRFLALGSWDKTIMLWEIQAAR